MTTYNVTIFGLHLKINPVAFTLPIGKNGWDIYWYGILIATGFLLAVLYAAKYAKRYDLNFDRLLDVVLVTAPVAVLCARTYYVLFDGERISGIYSPYATIRNAYGLSELLGLAMSFIIWGDGK